MTFNPDNPNEHTDQNSNMSGDYAYQYGQGGGEAADLDDLAPDWADKPAERAPRGDPPDGTYQCHCTGASLGYAKSGARMFTWSWEVASGQYAGMNFKNYSMLDSSEKLGYFKQDLSICGLNLAKASDIAVRQNELIGVMVEMQIKRTTKDGKEYCNKYINKQIVPTAPMVGMMPPPASRAPAIPTTTVGPAAPAPDDGDIPF